MKNAHLSKHIEVNIIHAIMCHTHTSIYLSYTHRCLYIFRNRMKDIAL